MCVNQGSPEKTIGVHTHTALAEWGSPVSLVRMIFLVDSSITGEGWGRMSSIDTDEFKGTSWKEGWQSAGRRSLVRT